MSVEIMAQVWKHSKQELGTLLVELALADFANDDGECWAKNETLAKKARLQDRMVRYAIRKLIDDGEIEKTSSPTGKRNCNTYHFLIEDRQSIATGKICHRQSIATQTGNPLPPTSSIYEPSVESSLQESPSDCGGLPPPPEPRKPVFSEEFWAIVKVCGINASEISSPIISRVKKCLKVILASTPSAGAADILARAGRYKKRFPDCALTPEALAKHWSTLGIQQQDQIRLPDNLI